MAETFRPIDLARAAGVSTQTVREYERFGFLPTAKRTVHGYRCYEERHLSALQATRIMLAGFGWENTLRIMKLLHQGELDQALHIVDACHAQLYGQHEEAERAVAMFTTLTTDQASVSHSQTPAQPQHIAEVAQLIGVKPSALRFWEAQGLICPTRDSRTGYRLYNEEQVRHIYAIDCLRHARYDLASIRNMLKHQDTLPGEEFLEASRRRIAALRVKSRRCSAATSVAWQYWQEWRVQ